MPKKYEFWSDPAHGWLRVHYFECQQAGILSKITPYSYYDGAFVYLEEDQDVGLFLNALRPQMSPREWFEQSTVNVEKSPRDFGHYYVPEHHWDEKTQEWIP